MLDIKVRFVPERFLYAGGSLLVAWSDINLVSFAYKQGRGALGGHYKKITQRFIALGYLKRWKPGNGDSLTVVSKMEFKRPT